MMAGPVFLAPTGIARDIKRSQPEMHASEDLHIEHALAAVTELHLDHWPAWILRAAEATLSRGIRAHVRGVKPLRAAIIRAFS